MTPVTASHFARSNPSVHHDSAVKPFIIGFDAEYDFVASVDDTLFFLTDHEAPRRRIIAVDAASPERKNWKQVIGKTTDVIESANLFGQTF